MTSTRPLADWGKLLPDVPTVGALLGRLIHHATVVTNTAERYGLDDAALAKPKESGPPPHPPVLLPVSRSATRRPPAQ